MTEEIKSRLLESVRVVLKRYEDVDITDEVLNDKINDVLYMIADIISASKVQEDRSE